MTPCPGDDELRRLLAGELPGDAAEPLARHADDCAACQGRLGRLLDDATVKQWRALLQPAGSDPDATRPEAVAAPEPAAPPGYQLLGELGRGGMGVVYRARQASLKRLVALKVLSAGAWADAEEVARFRAEAEAVARLQHPNIVQVYEVGEHQGRPFFSLEYVEGGSLADHLDGTPLSSSEAARLVEALARAVHHAHQHGVIHRDLKPANVLLASGGCEPPGEETPGGLRPPLAGCVPKITDFGLAKRVGSDDDLTRTGQVMGTPSYMAPEQARGQVHDVGAVTDVYALGALLYELLTGRAPFRGATALETLQQVVTEPPVTPARLNRQVPRDLETICLKCLEKGRPGRYPSAADLADDLGRFLAGRPILARPASALERAGKWARRRPAVAALLGGLTLAVLVVIAVLAVSYRKERDRALFARNVVDDMYTKVAEEWLADEPQMDPLRREFLDKALAFYREFARKDDTGPDARRRAALAYFRVGQIRRTLGERPGADEAYRQAIALQERLRDQFPGEPAYRQDLANSHNWLGELLREGGWPAEAAESYRTARALQDDLVRQFPDEPSYRRDLARSHYNLGIVEADAGRPDEAGRDYDRAFDLLTDPAARSVADPAVAHELARTCVNRGVLLRQNGRPVEAENDYRHTIQLLRGLQAAGRSRPDYQFTLAIGHQDLGNLLWDRRQYPEALAQLGRARDILGPLADYFPGRPRYQKKLARTYNSIGSVLAETNQPDQAEKTWEKARDLSAELARRPDAEPDAHYDLGVCLGNLGWLKAERRDPGAARPLFEEAIRQLRTARDASPKRLDYREALRNQYQALAETLVRSGDRTAAVEAATALAEVFPERALGHYYAACFVARCVPLAEKQQCPDGAARHAEQATALLKQALAKGLTGAERLSKEEEPFRPLAGRSGFDDELLTELEKRPRP